ncbi:hypothetical protein [Streptomyces sp. NPDC054961]
MPLLLPPRLTASAVRLRDTARSRGLATVRPDGFAVPEGLFAARDRAFLR